MPLRCAILVLAILPVAARAVGVQDRPPFAEGAKVRAAAISFVPAKFDLQGNADRLERLFRQAAAGGAKIAVAPEGALEGYVVNEIIAGQAPESRMKDVAIAIDDPLMERFRKLAVELKMCLVFGFAECIGRDVFNCAVFIDDSGRLCGKQHKMQLAEGYDESWWFNRLGEHSRAFDTPYGRGGLLICNDRWNPEVARILVLDAARFLMIPSFGSRSAPQDEAVLSRARENGVPIVEANVGVVMVVDQGAIVALDRQESTIAYGEITIPSAVAPDRAARDRAESEFLRWRKQEMARRLAVTRKRLAEKAANPP